MWIYIAHSCKKNLYASKAVLGSTNSGEVVLFNI